MKPLSLAGPYEEPRADLVRAPTAIPYDSVVIIGANPELQAIAKQWYVASEDESGVTIRRGRPKGSKNKAKSVTNAVTVSKA